MPGTGSGRRRPGRKLNRRVGAIIATSRAEAGISQEELSRVTGIRKVRLSRLEGGLVRLLAEEIPVLCAALGIGPLRLLPLDGERA